MRPKTIIVLAVLAVAAAAAAAVALSLDSGARRDPRVGAPVFPDLIDRANDVASITVESNLGVLTLERGPAGWSLRESGGYPVMAVKANGSVLDLATLRFHEPKTSRPEKYAKLNLRDFDAPGSRSTRVTVRNAAGEALARLIVGNSKFNLPGTKTGGVYIRLPGEAQTWLAQGDVNFGGLPSHWLEPKILDIAGERIKRVEIRRPAGEPVVITKRNAKSLVYSLEDLPDGLKLKYKDEPKLIATNLEAFELEDARPAGSVAFEPARTTRTVFRTFDGLEVAVESTKRADATWIRFAFAAADGSADRIAAEARALADRTKPWVYRIADYRAARLTKSLAELVEPAS